MSETQEVLGTTVLSGASPLSSILYTVARADRDKYMAAQEALNAAANAPLLRSFETGATRSPDAGRPDPEGFMSPIVVECFSDYMNRNRVQSDGTVRASDNWQKGIPLPVYAKGLSRHYYHFWTRHRGYQVMDPMAAKNIKDDLCAIMFNAAGYLFELLKAEQARLA